MKFQGVHVHRATGLKSSDWFSKFSDPYFICRIGYVGSTWNEKACESNGIQFESNAIKNTLDPEWDAKFVFNLDEDILTNDHLSGMIKNLTSELAMPKLEITLRIYGLFHLHCLYKQ